MGCDQNQCEASDDKIVSIFKDYGLKTKMETMQKRIDELKAKVKFEGNFIVCEEKTLESDFFHEPFDDLKNDLSRITTESDCSDKSLYYSASDFSVSSQCSTTDSTLYNFSGFVENFLTNQNEKERFSLLQLHSEKQISLNVSKNLLEELEMRCVEEMRLVDKSLEQLDRLAKEFGVKNYKSFADFEPNYVLRALE